MLRWMLSQILHTPPITLGKLLYLEKINLSFNKVFLWIFYYIKNKERNLYLINMIVIGVKLTQGTGRGTCWWSIFIFIFLFFYTMSNLFFLSNTDIYIYSSLEDLFVVIMVYSFFKLILLSSMVELIWPTQFFNRRHLVFYCTTRFRTFTEFFLKLRVSIYTTFNTTLVLSS